MHLHMHQALRCRARTRRGSPCQSPAMKNGRCRMHGGPSPGAPKGNQNALKHGRYTAQAMERRRGIATLLRAARALAHPDRADGRNANSHTQTGKGTKVICTQCGRPGGNQVASGDEIGPVWLHHECEASWIERRMGEEGIKLRQPDSPEKRGTSDISQAPQELPDIPVPAPEEASSQPPIRPSNGGGEPGISSRGIAEIKEWVEDQEYRVYSPADIAAGKLDAALRAKLRELVLPEFVEIEFKRVMKVVGDNR